MTQKTLMTLAAVTAIVTLLSLVIVYDAMTAKPERKIAIEENYTPPAPAARPSAPASQLTPMPMSDAMPMRQREMHEN
ncbi:MAG: hypothetical protein KTR28_01905 [Micavibrio sp.]|nr:hypothetical protein [Micavibrio sp.]